MLFHYFLPYTYTYTYTYSLHCQLFLLISGYYTTCNMKITYQCKIIIVPEEGWFGQPKYSTHKTRSFYVVSTSAFIFFTFDTADNMLCWGHSCLLLSS